MFHSAIVPLAAQALIDWYGSVHVLIVDFFANGRKVSVDQIAPVLEAAPKSVDPAAVSVHAYIQDFLEARIMEATSFSGAQNGA